MATQKAALVGCEEGPWVSTSMMRDLRLRVQGVLRTTVQQTDGSRVVEHGLDGEGVFKLADMPWTRVFVAEGDPKAALCFLVSGNG